MAIVSTMKVKMLCTYHNVITVWSRS